MTEYERGRRDAIEQCANICDMMAGGKTAPIDSQRDNATEQGAMCAALAIRMFLADPVEPKPEAASEDYVPTPEELARLCEKEDTALASPPQAASGVEFDAMGGPLPKEPTK